RRLRCAHTNLRFMSFAVVYPTARRGPILLSSSALSSQSPTVPRLLILDLLRRHSAGGCGQSSRTTGAPRCLARVARPVHTEQQTAPDAAGRPAGIRGDCTMPETAVAPLPAW